MKPPESHLTKGLHEAGMLPIWFQRIFGEIEEVRTALYAKKGILFLKVHKFTQDDIFQYPAFQSMRALCEQIDSLVSRWRLEDNITDQVYRYYHDTRLEVERRMTVLKAEILNRNPTMLETIGEFFSKAIKWILQILPLLPQVLLARIGVHSGSPRRISKFDSDLDDY